MNERVFSGCTWCIVPQAAAALVGPDVPLAAFLGRIPNLDLRRGPQVDAAVGLGDGFVFDEKLDVAVGLVGGEIGPVAIVHQFALVGFPVGERIFFPLVPELSGIV